MAGLIGAAAGVDPVAALAALSAGARVAPVVVAAAGAPVASVSPKRTNLLFELGGNAVDKGPLPNRPLEPVPTALLGCPDD